MFRQRVSYVHFKEYFIIVFFGAYSVYWGHGCVFGLIFFAKRAHLFVCAPTEISLLMISNIYSVFQESGARLVAKVRPNKGLK